MPTTPNPEKSETAAEAEEWQLGEIQAGIAELDRAAAVSHEKVSKWLGSWGKAAETKAPG